MLTLILVLCTVWFLLGYLIYGRMLRTWFGLDNANPPPAVTMYDGVDYCPARTPVLFGHHFSSIAGAGPIVGPILAGVYFGWGPALAWILLGAVLIGGVHDMGALIASIRHRALSVAEVARETISPAAQRLFLLFIWLALILVLACFIDLTAKTFLTKTAELDGGSVATSSGLYILLALAFGLVMYRFKVRLARASLVFVPLVFAGIYIGLKAPLPEPALSFAGLDASRTYVLILVVYCFVASLAPVWVLLQPRDYLSSYLLFTCLLAGGAGILFGTPAVAYPFFCGFSHDQAGPLFPFLFILIACGACSGFHSIVASGTTAKQVTRETDACRVGYGGMLLEGVLAVLALATVMVVSKGSPDLDHSPTVVFASGLGRFTEVLGIPLSLGIAFGLLAISTFLLATLDTCTRLSRFILEEMVGSRTTLMKWLATLVTLLVPVILLNTRVTGSDGSAIPAYRLIWPLFGATNQLLGGLALLTVTLWLRSIGRPAWFTGIPCIFMILMTMTALVFKITDVLTRDLGRVQNAFQAGYCGFLLLLACFMVVEAIRKSGAAQE